MATQTNQPKRYKTEIINLRVSSDTKERSKKVLSRERLDHSKAIRLFLEHIAKEGKLPDYILDECK